MSLHLYLFISEKRPDIGGSGEDLLIVDEDADPDPQIRSDMLVQRL
jgi:hypothetical protein